MCAAGFVCMALITAVDYPPQYRNNLRSVMALATITLVGAWIGNALQRSRREEFASVLQERWSNQRLLAEIAAPAGVGGGSWSGSPITTR